MLLYTASNSSVLTELLVIDIELIALLRTLLTASPDTVLVLPILVITFELFKDLYSSSDISNGLPVSLLSNII